jgi:D-beta-D-heptose 7-phosphate kinase/D-beta-D-heptose 1-phosphate adenosyltransferase
VDEQRLHDLLARFPDVRVLAVGDVYLDENVFGRVTEVSLEAPIPVFAVLERRYNPGAAGNAACNAASLGAKVSMVGVIGADMNAEILKREFAARGVDTSGLVTDPARPTNTYGKLRAGGHNTPLQEVLRTDTPKPEPIAGEIEAEVIRQIERLAPEADAVLLGDQVASVITERVWAAVRSCAEKHGLVTLADSRRRAGMFKGVTVIKPNDAEAGLASGIEVKDEASMEAAGRFLLQSAQNVLLTRGPAGITVFAADGTVTHVPITQPVQVVDVTGAGDTVAATALLTLAGGGTLVEAAFLGNVAAGIAIAQPGVVTVSREELEQALFGTAGPAKLKRLAALKGIVERLKREGRRVVWTNGCFDILHVGHITYLLRARAEGDALVLGLNSDASVQRIKGPERPVVNEHDRAMVLSALECVDYLVIFDEPSPIGLIDALRPDVYAKGGDYTIDTINQEERRLVESYGGRIAIIPGVPGQSTTSIIEKILAEE